MSPRTSCGRSKPICQRLVGVFMEGKRNLDKPLYPVGWKRSSIDVVARGLLDTRYNESQV